MSLNRIILIGRMVRDPELRTTTTGKNVVEFSIAVDKRLKPQNPTDPTADFFRVKAWGSTADFVSNYGSKGRLTSVEGRLESRKYTDRDGNNREIFEVIADNVSLLDRPRDDQGGGGGGGGTQSASTGSSAPRSTAAAPSSDEYDPFADE